MLHLRSRRCHGWFPVLALVLLTGVWSPRAAGQDGPGHDPALRREFARLIGELDAAQFHRRQEAQRRLEALAARPDLAAPLAAELRRALEGDVPLEVRWRLEQLLDGLPAGRPAARAPAAEQLQRWIAALDADSYDARQAAERRMQALLQHDALVCPVLTALKQALARDRLGLHGHKTALRLYEAARATWILSDPDTWSLPEVSPGEINRLVQALAAAESSPRRRATARRELLDLLARDDYVAAVRQALKDRLAHGGLKPPAQAALDDLFEWAQPSLVAEVWQGRQQVTIQYLLVDVPQFPEGAQRATHFDRVDEETAHCVSGSSLTEGDYPIGQAIPHPARTGLMFHLVNTPTPRRRMAYRYRWERTTDEQRLRAISQRTMQALVSEKRRLSDLEILLLAELDPEVVSRRIGDYFLAVEDRPVEEFTQLSVGGRRVSHHARICYVLATIATHEAVPGLTKAAAAGRFIAPAAGDNPYDMPWIAALAIAARDPWPKADDWLAGLIGDERPLYVSDEQQRAITPTLGATAAAILAQRRGYVPEDLGLTKLEHGLMNSLSCPGYRFVSKAQQQALLDRWAPQPADIP